MDITTLFGIALGLGGILIGNLVEGGSIASLVQGTAAFIVLGGTLGATIVANRRQHLKLAWQYLRLALKSDDEERLGSIAKEIIYCANLAKKESILSLEARIKNFKSDYMKNVFRFIVDGVEADKIESIFISDIEIEEDKKMQAAKVWSDAGGYAPTIGIIGAVLGLIHVMANLTNTSELGKGIAVAFVATIYGVGIANLFFLPISNKIKRKIEFESLEKYMIVEGAILILKDYSPYLIEEKMRSYTRVDN
jgi:chemotaxis protein MotA